MKNANAMARFSAIKDLNEVVYGNKEAMLKRQRVLVKEIAKKQLELMNIEQQLKGDNNEEN
jgi:hypothetical protein